ncbi:MAG TPA: DUF1570 domain-containing protein [Bryobacteraceae bacterium]|nr:DUF1570 domain-containing protein [Bryobacteraceae bacterium]
MRFLKGDVSSPIICVVLLGIFARVSSPAAEPWVRVSTHRIKLYSSTGKESASALVQVLAQAHDVLAKIMPLPNTYNGSITVVLFGSQAEFRSYSGNPGACAYHQRAKNTDYIAMWDRGPENDQIAIHEYVHAMIDHAGVDLPVWLTEGLAEFYSCYRSDERQILIGAPIVNRLAILRRSPWMKLSLLLSVTHSSSYYNSPETMATFYAQSWLLAHMLALSPAYASRFGDFLSTITRNANSVAALEATYARSLEQIEADLMAYSPKEKVAVAAFNVQPRPSASRPPIAFPSEHETDLALAELLAADPNQQAKAERQLKAISEKYPDDPESEGCLGYVAMRAGRLGEARAHFMLAVDRHSSDPQVFYYAAHLDQRCSNQRRVSDPDLGIGARNSRASLRGGTASCE